LDFSGFYDSCAVGSRQGLSLGHWSFPGYDLSDETAVHLGNDIPKNPLGLCSIQLLICGILDFVISRNNHLQDETNTISL